MHPRRSDGEAARQQTSSARTAMSSTDVSGQAVGQVSLEMIPDALVGVQLWGIRRERLQVESGRAAEQLLHGLPAMNAAIVQQHNEVVGDLAQQGAEDRSRPRRPGCCPHIAGSTACNGRASG
jgi:hypothetical protein